MTLPARTARLFHHEPLPELTLPAGRNLLIGRLLEDGDGDDLRWLVSEVGEPALVDWLERFGRRKLSRRSRAFWSSLLGVPCGAAGERAGELWPL